MNDREDLNKMKQEAQDAENRKEYFEASILYKNLLGEASKQNNSELIAEAKNKMVEMNGLAEGEYKEITGEAEVSREDIEKQIKYILGDSQKLDDVLYRIGHHPHMYPKKKEIEDTTVVPIFRALASNHITSKDNHALGGNDQKYISYIENYGMHQSVIMQLCMGRLFNELYTKYGLNLDTLMAYFESKKVFSQENLFFIKSGLKNFFEEDYCAAIHVLVPRFERCFVELSKALGINTVSLKRNKKGVDDVVTSDITLSIDILRKKEFTDKWTEDFCEHVIYVFYERLGYGLRHKVAHGTLSSGEAHKNACELIIYFYLVLAARIKMKDTDK